MLRFLLAAFLGAAAAASAPVCESWCNMVRGT